jgi:hypothetical protein
MGAGHHYDRELAKERIDTETLAEIRRHAVRPWGGLHA